VGKKKKKKTIESVPPKTGAQQENSLSKMRNE
jgi:hypothetical protein